jgi:hypothetical protein
LTHHSTSASRNDTLGVPNESFALAYVVVRAWSLNALIAPGDRQVSRLSSLVLDASASLRPGQIAEDVQFAWSCFSEEDPDAPCMNWELLQEYLSTDAPRIVIPSSTLNPGEYVFNVSVSYRPEERHVPLLRGL